MSYVLYRDKKGTEYRFFGHEWYFFRLTMREYGWEPKKTLLYTVHSAVRLPWGAFRNGIYSVDKKDLFEGETPASLAKEVAEYSGLPYPELLRHYIDQWDGDTLKFVGYLDLDWDGSYDCNADQYVTKEDALGMSRALERAAEDREKGVVIGFPDDWPDESLRGGKPSFFLLDNKDLIEHSDPNDPPRPLVGVEALRTFAAWLALGEFRIC